MQFLKAEISVIMPSTLTTGKGKKMNHDDWVRRELREGSLALGFRYTPLNEIENRLARIRAGMEKQGIEGLLVIQKMDFYYLSGTTQDGLLFVPLEGKPLLMMRRELERARVESPVQDVVPLKSNREIPLLMQNHCGKVPRTLGLELDVLPVKDTLGFKKFFRAANSRTPLPSCEKHGR
jgi:Xaa-Pro aminopeptidase